MKTPSFASKHHSVLLLFLALADELSTGKQFASVAAGCARHNRRRKMNTKQPHLAIFVLVTSLVISACGPGQAVPTPTLTHTATPVPTSTPTPLPLQSGNWNGTIGVPTYNQGDLNIILSFEVKNDQIDSWSAFIVNCGMVSFGQGTRIENNIFAVTIVNPCNFTGTQIDITGEFTLADRVAGTATYGKYQSNWNGAPEK
ncbi:MAG: hypothetical protein JW730_09150 [Anaerolineales bacterium]|nr:hypothetical protein [Anaerolineales bacterium]